MHCNINLKYFSHCVIGGLRERQGRCVRFDCGHYFCRSGVAIEEESDRNRSDHGYIAATVKVQAMLSNKSR